MRAKLKRLRLITLFSLPLWLAFFVYNGSIVFVNNDSAVVQWGGADRLGDQLVQFSKAKWLAKNYELPFFYRKFDFSDDLLLSESNELFDEDQQASAISIPIIRSIPVLYVFPKRLSLLLKFQFNNDLLPNGKAYDLLNFLNVKRLTFSELLLDDQLRDELRQEVKAKFPLHSIEKPLDRKSVAVHMRRGSGPDTPFQENGCASGEGKPCNETMPKRFPPLEYFVQQIDALCDLLQDDALFVHIFTDDKNPEQLIQRLQAAVKSENIIFKSRASHESYDNMILEDLFAMSEFDCLIRSSSDFSRTAQLIGNHQVVMSPESYRRGKEGIYISKVQVCQRDKESGLKFFDLSYSGLRS